MLVFSGRIAMRRARCGLLLSAFRGLRVCYRSQPCALQDRMKRSRWRSAYRLGWVTSNHARIWWGGAGFSGKEAIF